MPCANIDIAFFPAALDGFAQYSMDDQVRIAADWRRKVCVGLHRQPEVTRVPRRVTCALHRTKHQIRKHTLFRLALNLARKLLKAALRNRTVHREFVPERRGDLRELFDLFGIRLFVYAVEQRNGQ